MLQWNHRIDAPMVESPAVKAPFSYLFVPGNRPERFDKALGSGADAIIVDLEDAVAADEKVLARAHIGAWLDGQTDVGERVLVRINDAGTPWFDADLGLVRGTGIRAIMLPKVEHGQQIDRVRAAPPAAGFVVP